MFEKKLSSFILVLVVDMTATAGFFLGGGGDEGNDVKCLMGKSYRDQYIYPKTNQQNKQPHAFFRINQSVGLNRGLFHF